MIPIKKFILSREDNHLRGVTSILWKILDEYNNEYRGGNEFSINELLSAKEGVDFTMGLLTEMRVIIDTVPGMSDVVLPNIQDVFKLTNTDNSNAYY
jgi:hypothetical protein